MIIFSYYVFLVIGSQLFFWLFLFYSISQYSSHSSTAIREVRLLSKNVEQLSTTIGSFNKHIDRKLDSFEESNLKIINLLINGNGNNTNN
jgi:hypothetical protein